MKIQDIPRLTVQTMAQTKFGERGKVGGGGEKATEVHKKDFTQNGFDLNHHAVHLKYTKSLLKK